MIVLWVTLRNDEFGPSAPSDYQQGPLPMGTPRPQISMRPRPEVPEWLIGSRVRSRILTGTEIGLTGDAFTAPYSAPSAGPPPMLLRVRGGR
jgi:hypothetical protein